MSITDRVLGHQSTPTVRASAEDVMHVLKNRRRRLVIELVAAEAGPIRIGDLAERIAARENDTTVRKLDSSQRKNVYVGLYQLHLDTLADAGAIAPWTNTEPVRPGPEIGAFDALREIVEGRTDVESGDGPVNDDGSVGRLTELPAILSGCFRQPITKISETLPIDSEMATKTGGESP